MILPVCLNATMDQTTNTAECVEEAATPLVSVPMRTLLIGVAVLAIPCGYVAREVKIVRNRQAVRDRLKDFGVFHCRRWRRRFPAAHRPESFLAAADDGRQWCATDSIAKK